MKREEFFAIGQLDSFSRGNEKKVSYLTRARMILLREIIKRLNEIKSNALKKDDIRNFIESDFQSKTKRSELRQINRAIRNEGLRDILGKLYANLSGKETNEQRKNKLLNIENKLASCPEENFSDLIGAYLRIKRKLQKKCKITGYS